MPSQVLQFFAASNFPTAAAGSQVNESDCCPHEQSSSLCVPFWWGIQCQNMSNVEYPCIFLRVTYPLWSQPCISKLFYVLNGEWTHYASDQVKQSREGTYCCYELELQELYHQNKAVNSLCPMVLALSTTCLQVKPSSNLISNVMNCLGTK